MTKEKGESPPNTVGICAHRSPSSLHPHSHILERRNKKKTSCCCGFFEKRKQKKRKKGTICFLYWLDMICQLPLTPPGLVLESPREFFYFYLYRFRCICKQAINAQNSGALIIFGLVNSDSFSTPHDKKMTSSKLLPWACQTKGLANPPQHIFHKREK